MKHADELTLFTGGALPALFADAGEGVSAPHAGPTVGARIGGTGAVLGFRGQNTLTLVQLTEKIQTEREKLISLTLSCIGCSNLILGGGKYWTILTCYSHIKTIKMYQNF